MTVSAGRRWYRSLAEGLLWGLAVWIKPHVLVPALAVWLVSLRFQARRAAVFDTLAPAGRRPDRRGGRAASG